MSGWSGGSWEQCALCAALRGLGPTAYDEVRWDTLGMRGTVSPAVEFDDCFIAEVMVLGDPGGMLKVGVVELFSLGYAAIYLGAAEGALDHAVEYYKSDVYKPDPLPIAHDAATQRDVGPTLPRTWRQPDCCYASAPLSGTKRIFWARGCWLPRQNTSAPRPLAWPHARQCG